MNLQEALAAATEQLAAAGVASPAYDARALALHVLGLQRPSDLLTAGDIDEGRYAELVRRRAARVPLQHLLGTAAFRHLELRVGPGVFVPRPESELVAGAAIEEARARTDPQGAPTFDPPPARHPQHGGTLRSGAGDPVRFAPVVVDLCSGSGAIALSVAHEAPGVVVHAVELDPTALDWARRNDPDGTVTWHLGPVAGCLPDLDGQVDVVVSNPPYVPVGSSVQRETEHDPQVALWGGADGLDVVRDVEVAARRLLRAGGLVVVEHDDTQQEAVAALFGEWDDVAGHEDLTGRPRFVTARWSG